MVAVASKLIAKNKKAYFDYEILEKYETGIVLTGSEVKSIKEGRVQLKGSFVTIWKGKVLTENLHISPYRYSVIVGYDPMRRRQLLLKKKEILYLAGLINEQGLTLVPLELTLKKGLIKMIIGVARGKKQHDKRNVLKHRAMDREINQGLKKFSR